MGWLGRAAAALALVSAVLSAMTEARADWQYTRWGMSPEQVIAASRGTAKPSAGPELGDKSERLLVISNTEIENVVFWVSFYFSRSTGGLSRIFVQKDDCTAWTASRLRLLLRAKFGHPIKTTDLSTTEHPFFTDDWRAGHDIVQLAIVQDGPKRFYCWITYQPIPAGL